MKLLLLILTLHFAVAATYPENSQSSSRLTTRQILNSNMFNCGGNHTNKIFGKRSIQIRKRQITNVDMFNCLGNHENNILGNGRRKRRNIIYDSPVLRTDPNNIQVIVGNTQPFPVLQNLSETQSFQPNIVEQKQNNYFGGHAFGNAIDTENTEGTHENRVVIGGIQNFGGGNILDSMGKLKGDVGNTGGTHKNNVEIGGILNF